jgi:tetratricopeptide (TPR) repeat protein
VAALDLLAYVQQALSRQEEAGEACLQRALIDPFVGLQRRHACASSLEYAGRRHDREGRPTEARRAFDKALLLDPNHTAARAARVELLRRGDPNRNPAELASLRERAEREGTFDNYRTLNDALADRRRFAEVIANWTRYITAHAGEEHRPAYASAHLFRGHTRAAICDPAGAASDAEYACELGHPAACKHADVYRKQASERVDAPVSRSPQLSPKAPQRTERRTTSARTVPQRMERETPPPQPAERRIAVALEAPAEATQGPTPLLQPLVAGLP